MTFKRLILFSFPKCYLMWKRVTCFFLLYINCEKRGKGLISVFYFLFSMFSIDIDKAASKIVTMNPCIFFIVRLIFTIYYYSSYNILISSCKNPLTFLIPKKCFCLFISFVYIPVIYLNSFIIRKFCSHSFPFLRNKKSIIL